MSYFLESLDNKNKIEIELDLFDYATEPNMKNAIRIDISQFAKKYDLANLKTDFGKLDLENLKTASIHLSKLNKRSKQRYW